MGLGALLRAGMVATGVPSEALLFAVNPLQSLIHGFVFAHVIVVSFGFLLMCNDRVHAELRRLATHDPLTGALNRGAIERRLRDECRAGSRSRTSVAVLLLDVDHFKQINDGFGHRMGDHVLQQLVSIIGRTVRCGDAVGRFGGDMVVLSNTRLEQAHAVAERLRSRIEQAPFGDADRSLRCTISLGVAALTPDEDDPEALVQRDEALYDAKRRGRNRSVLADPGPVPVVASLLA